MRPDASIALSTFVPGRPATFATALERPWKEALASALSQATPDPSSAYIELEFVVRAAHARQPNQDLDNLCEPVFSVLANRLGWFGGRRPNIRGWRASKRVGAEPGCRITIRRELPRSCPMTGFALLDAIYIGPLPEDGRDLRFAEWARMAMERPALRGAATAIEIRFGQRVNLGDIATGRTKNVIDSLYPVLGGTAGAPRDEYVSGLEVTWNLTDAGGVSIRVMEVAGCGE